MMHTPSLPLFESLEGRVHMSASFTAVGTLGQSAIQVGYINGDTTAAAIQIGNSLLTDTPKLVIPPNPVIPGNPVVPIDGFAPGAGFGWSRAIPPNPI
jgi:hypothetical protein